MRDIADAAGVALSQLNYHYKNKEGLFIEVINLTIENYLKELECYLNVGISPQKKCPIYFYILGKCLRKIQKHSGFCMILQVWHCGLQLLEKN
jgi:AcrR family transcriptional regulator